MSALLSTGDLPAEGRTPSVGYRRDIDGLRAIAIVPVILFHSHVAAFSGGYLGVDVFFVVSGYLITSLIGPEIAEGRFSYLSFWERRARRLLPAMFLVVAATALALLLGRPRLFGLGGAWLGFGGIWSVFLLRASVECAMSPPSSDECSSRLFQTYLVVGILMAAVGVLATVKAFRGVRGA